MALHTNPVQNSFVLKKNNLSHVSTERHMCVQYMLTSIAVTFTWTGRVQTTLSID